MKRFLLAVTLACALAGPALAGDIHSVGAPAPGNTPITGEPAPGDIETPGRDGNQGAGGFALLILDWLF